MYVKEILIGKFRHLENVRIGPFFTPSESSDVVVLAGPNGGGKSSVLELLGYALSNMWSLSWGLRRSFPENSFRVTLALTSNEHMRVREFLTQNPYDDVEAYFEESAVYHRSFNYTVGQSQQNQHLENSIHSVVSQALAQTEKPGLSFFLKSDRSYPPESFQRQRLFDYPQMVKQEHLRTLAFNTSDSQYRDMFDFLVQQRYHYFRQLGAHHHKINTLLDIGENRRLKPAIFAAFFIFLSSYPNPESAAQSSNTTFRKPSSSRPYQYWGKCALRALSSKTCFFPAGGKRFRGTPICLTPTPVSETMV